VAGVRSVAAVIAFALALGACQLPRGGADSGPTPEERLQQRLDAVQQDLEGLHSRLSEIEEERQADTTGIRESLETLTVEVEELRQQVREQRGQLEVAQHELERLKERQRRLYEDVDVRLRALEKGEPAPSRAEDGGDRTGSPAGENGGADEADASTGAEPAGPEEAYRAAFSRIEDNEYEAAAEAFGAFLEDHPDSDLAANARYWLGESHYVMRDFERALGEFNKVLQNHPDSRKAAAALLKIGYSFYELGEYKSAREALNRVRDRFPDTSEARLAKKRLERMDEEGN